eukprot:13388497-Alexandrium_andersonii.AAC.1
MLHDDPAGIRVASRLRIDKPSNVPTGNRRHLGGRRARGNAAEEVGESKVANDDRQRGAARRRAAVE